MPETGLFADAAHVLASTGPLTQALVERVSLIGFFLAACVTFQIDNIPITRKTDNP